MKREVKAGVNFFKRLAVTGGKLDEAKAQLFAEKLQRLLCDKYDGHWYPDRPTKGQAFRCIRINKGIPTDEVLLKACKESELTPSDLCLPPEVTVWIDPLEVCVRSRESSYPFSIASFTDNDEEEEEESVNKAQEDLPIDPTNHDTSDYHSATSSDCGSAVSSDTEEEVAVAAKSQETEGEQEKKPPAEKQPAQDDVFKIMKVPKIRRRHEGGSNRVSYYRNVVPVRRHFFCPPVPVWSHCMNHAPMLVVAPPPPPPCPVLVHYLPHPPPPHFVVPRAALKPWEPAKDEMLGLRSSAVPI